MEIGLEEGIPTYSGGLGMLAGDTIRSAADLDLPMVAVSLLHRRGYFRQRLAADGTQTEEPVTWSPADRLQELPARASVEIERREVRMRAWRYEVKGISNSVVPVYLLDTDLEENADGDRRLTDHLYGGDARYRLCQEVILGIGGVRMLRALGYKNIRRFHMNEGHASLLTVELANEFAVKAGTHDISPEVVAQVKPLVRLHDPHAGGRRPRQVSAVAPRPRHHRLRPRFRQACDRLLPEWRAQHDLPGAGQQPLHQRRGEEARRSLAAHVRAVQDRLDHQRRARGHLGGAAVARAVRSPHSQLARSTTPACVTRWASRNWKSGTRIAAPSRR